MTPRTHEYDASFCTICGGRDVAAGTACVVFSLPSAAGRLTRASRERDERQRKAARPFATWLYVRSDTHVIDHNGDACEIVAAGDSARNLTGRLLTPTEVTDAKRKLRLTMNSYGNVRAIRVNVYKKRGGR